MIMTIKRGEAINILAKSDLGNLKLGERENILLDLYNGDERFEQIIDFSSTEFDKDIVEFLKLQ